MAFANIIFLVLIDLLASQPSPYIGILAYMVAPAFLVLGLVLIPIGMVVERRRRLRELPAHRPASRSSISTIPRSAAQWRLFSASW